MIGRTLDHYEVMGLLGEGGMGGVYRAVDTRLKRDVALKILRAELAHDPTILARFRHEAEAVAALNHPGIVTIYSVEEADGLPFLTMELVRGESLDQRIGPAGLPLEEFLDLGVQIADAMAAAHARGITHRDLKPSNVMVTEEGRVKILDFGLAKALAPEGEEANEEELATKMFTTPGLVLGTVPYMSPEQVIGREVDHRTDIFSLGVMLYEMATGKRPFAGDNGAELMSSILRDTPPPLHELRDDLPRQLEPIIGTALAKRRDDRWQTALDIRNALRNLQLEHATGTWSAAAEPAPAPATPWARYALYGAAVLTVALLAAWGYSRIGPPAGTAPTVTRSADVSRPRLAVLGFKNLGSPEDAWLSTALSELVSTDLATTGELRLIPGESVARMRHDLELSDADTLAADTLDRIRRRLGTELVLLGSYLALPPQDGERQVSLMLRVQDTARGDSLLSVRETGRAADLFELVAAASERMREELQLRPPSAEEAEAVRATLPESDDAARLYAVGLDRLRSYAAFEARDLLQQAIDLEPDYALAYAALARADFLLGYDQAAADASNEAVRLSTDLPRAVQLRIRGQHFEVLGDWPQAAETYRLLREDAPDDLEAGLRLVRSLTESGQREQALQVVAELRQLPVPDRDDPRIDLEEAYAARWFFDPDRSLEVAREAVRKGEERGAKLLTAEGHRFAAMALEQLGRADEAAQEFATARDGFTAEEDWGSVGRVLIGMGVLHLNLDELNEARTVLNQALQITEDNGYERETGWAYTNLGILTYRRGDLAGAQERLEKALEVARATGNRNIERNVTGHLADVALDTGDLAASRQYARRSLETAEAIEERDGAGWAWFRLAAVELQAGDLEAAEAALQSALSIGRDIDYAYLIESTLRVSAILAIYRDDGAAAQALLEDALRTADGDAPSVDARITEAQVYQATGRIDEAVGVVDGLLDELRQEDRALALASMLALRAELALEGGGDVDLEELAGRLERARPGQDARLIRLDVDIALGALEDRLGRGDDSLRRLAGAVDDARRNGLLAAQLRAELALGRTESDLGMAGAADGLADLSRRARAAGFERIARLAEGAGD